MSGLHSSIVKSCFSLAKYNNGLFKSEKQGAFLSQLGNVIESRQVHTLGEQYNNKICGRTFWTIQLDDQGITKITKSNTKGESLHFEREQQAIFENKQALINHYKMLADDVNTQCSKAIKRKSSLIDFINASHANVVLSLMNSEVYKTLSKDDQTSAVLSLAKKLEVLKEKAQKQVNRLEKKITFYNMLADKYYYMVRQGVKRGASL